MMETIWNYYKTLAEKTGVDEKGKEQGFSVSWFYKEKTNADIYNSLNVLTKAFLGDEDSLDAVMCASKDELTAMMSEVRNICGSKPYPAQIEAISQAILNDITVIQGPPGTGKTETIKNILLCLRTLRPEAKIAVISANSEAISNAEDEVKKDETLKKSYARLGRRELRKKYKESMRIENPELFEQMECCNKNNDWKFPSALLDTYPIIFSTIHSLSKCVDTDAYDYVIVDECSQVPSMVGMLAISMAKHLVLLGDDEQLPPIHKEENQCEVAGVVDLRAECPWYLDEKDNSFMKACKKSFKDECRNILLNEHYRCHPAIIEFCNQEVYGNKLITRTGDDGELPIRIRWYEGDYWERIDATEGVKTKNYNRKQIEIFVRDEYPEIISLIRDNAEYSVCVLSPYRTQLEELKKRLDQINIADMVETDNVIEEPDENVNDIPQLTIHKAQGRGYDRVYIMPVQDVGRNPWSQRKNIINVAVSRAKKELCIITSATWMSKQMQKKLLGYVSHKEVSENGEYYLSKLLRYVEDEQEKRTVDTKYGFIQTTISSVFDKTLYYRNLHSCGDERFASSFGGVEVSAPEYCMRSALTSCREIKQKYNIYYEVLLKDVEGIHAEFEELEAYIDNDARFDIVIARGREIHLIIEVDGAYHRMNEEEAYKDGLKNQAVQCLGTDFAAKKYLRIPTDGTTEDELGLVLDALHLQCEDSFPYLKEGEIEMQILDRKLEDAYELLKNELNEDLFEEKIGRVNFSDGNLPEYSDCYQAAYYMLKYAKFYALEYAMIYELALQILNDRASEESAAVTYSFGCGSMVDALSYLYAHRKLRNEADEYRLNQKIYYRGIDLVRWPDSALLDLGQVSNEDMDVDVFLETGMVDFWNKMKTFKCNVLFFPKLLSEDLDEGSEGGTVIDQFCDLLEQANLDKDYIILGISYRGLRSYQEDYVCTQKIIDAMLDKGYVKDEYDYKDYSWNGAEYFELYDNDNKIFKSKDDVEMDYSKFQEFSQNNEASNYLSTGQIIRDHCRYCQEDANVSEICKQCGEREGEEGCKIRSIPRKNFNSGWDNTCFQILAFRRGENE